MKESFGAPTASTSGRYGSATPGSKLPVHFSEKLFAEYDESTMLRRLLFCEIICRICPFAAYIKILLFSKNCHILILTKKELFFTKDTYYYSGG